LKCAADLHKQIAKTQEQLAESINKEFEISLQRNFQAHSKKVDDNEKAFDKTMRKIQDEITKTENKMLKDRKKNLFAFQQSLQDMQRQAQELEKARQEQVDKMLGDEQKNFTFLLQKVAGLVKVSCFSGSINCVERIREFYEFRKFFS
jgi:small-conductance mechanosensitive channel